MRCALFLLAASVLHAQDAALRKQYEQGLRHLKLATSYLESRRDVEAVRELEEAEKLLPPSFELYYLLGEAYWNRSEFQKSLAQFKKAVGLNTASARAQFRLGYAQQLLGDLPAAKKSLETALKLDPELPLANLAMGHLLAGESKPGEALPFLQKYAHARPEDIEVRLKLAQINLDVGNTEQALAELKAAEQLAPREKRIHYLLGRVYTAARQPELAKQAFATFSSLEAADLDRKRLGGNAPYIKRE